MKSKKTSDITDSADESEIAAKQNNISINNKKLVDSFTRGIYFLLILSGFLFMASSCKPSVKKYTENARQLMLEGKFEEAIPILNTAIKKNSSSHEAYNLRGAAYLELDRFEKAKEDLDKAIKLHKKDYRYFYNRAKAKKVLKEYEAAVEDYNKAIALNEHVADMYLERGELFLTLHKGNESIKDLDKAVMLNASEKMAYFNRAEAHYLLHELKEAIIDLEKCVRLDEQFGKGHYRLAQIALEINQNRANRDICLHLKSAISGGCPEAEILINKVCR
ncbi:tetratricopeptide repeat protein (plasmid) [Bernardetia sp. Wsw4-3y2]|uniref:tetratricopeptide repeat protein n=1 Tax=Bernardetia sp. Wsw4-3y2 TaxID=3127471 RepID=UPI0030D016EE